MKKNYMVLALICTLFFAGCDRDLFPARFELVQSPRIVYIANVDTRLDFNGAMLKMVPIDGFLLEPFPLIFDDNYIIEGLIGFSRGRVEVTHSVDFTRPGIYEVTLIVTDTWGGETHFYVPFFVQVIDEEFFNQLSNPDYTASPL